MRTLPDAWGGGERGEGRGRGEGEGEVGRGEGGECLMTRTGMTMVLTLSPV